MWLGRWVLFPVCSWRNVASRPAACGRFDSYYSPHPWRPDLVIGSSSHRFQRGLNPLATRSAPGGTKMSLWFSCGKTSQPWLKRLKAFTVSTMVVVARIRRSRIRDDLRAVFHNIANSLFRTCSSDYVEYPRSSGTRSGPWLIIGGIT